MVIIEDILDTLLVTSKVLNFLETSSSFKKHFPSFVNLISYFLIN